MKILRAQLATVLELGTSLWHIKTVRKMLYLALIKAWVHRGSSEQLQQKEACGVVVQTPEARYYLRQKPSIINEALVRVLHAQ